MGGVTNEVVGLVWREDLSMVWTLDMLECEGMLIQYSLQRSTGITEIDLEQSSRVVGDVPAVEVELDSILIEDRDFVNPISISISISILDKDLISDFDTNLTIVPIVETNIIPFSSIVSQVTHPPSKVVVSNGVLRKVRLVNELILDTLSIEQRRALQKARCRERWGRARKVVQRVSLFGNEPLSDSDFQARQQVFLRETEASNQLGSLVGVETMGHEEDIIKDISENIMNQGTTS
ncbi:hypothetical protein V6N13_113980 [Hibiscus sabdariffa]